jgi:tryptophan synthase beta chain
MNVFCGHGKGGRMTGVPEAWYNLLADLPFAIPEDMPSPLAAPVRFTLDLPAEMRQQTLTSERWLPVPDQVRRLYQQWRPAPLRRALEFERVLGTRCAIYYKYEGGNVSGSHKLNTAIAQAYYYKQAGATRLTTGTGAGQWGTAVAAACSMLGMDCRVYMVRSSYHSKPYRKTIMEMLGATVLPSPSDATDVGRRLLAGDPEHHGSIPIASAEAIETTGEPGTYFSTGSAETYALLHQTVTGLEAQQQMAEAGEQPDVIVGSLGGGSGLAGLMAPFIGEMARGERSVRCVSVEPAACPKLTRGRYVYDFSDSSGLMPMQKMYTLGYTFEVPPIHAGGLRYHGTAKLISALYHHKLMDAAAYPQRVVFDTAVAFAKAEGVVPAPESAHALHGAAMEARRADEEGQSRCILVGISGHGMFDMAAYEAYHAGTMVDSSATEQQIAESLARIPQQPEEAA